MDKRATIAAFVGILLLLFLGRKRILDIITLFGGFNLMPMDDEVRELPATNVPNLGNFRPGPELWTQTTGLICECNSSPYVGPVLVREITIPQAPLPRYVFTAPPTLLPQAPSANSNTYTPAPIVVPSTDIQTVQRPMSLPRIISGTG